MAIPEGMPRYPGDVIGLLATTEFFGGLAPDQLAHLVRVLEWETLPGGATLVRQGEPGDCLYILAHGRLVVMIHHPSGTDVPVGEVARGELVGEMAVLTDAPRSATVRAVRDSQLLKLSKEACTRLFAQHPEIMLHITRQIVERVQARNVWKDFVRMSTIAVIPAGRAAKAGGLPRRLAESLARFGPTLHVTSALVDRALGPGAAQTPPGLAARSLLSWLNDQEARYASLVYESDAVDSEWTRRCRRQADRILLVGSSDDDPALSAAEVGLARLAPEAKIRTELVLLHETTRGAPARTGEWLALRQVDGHHHVRVDVAADIERLTRLVTGRAVGVVLGGGGGRAIAHIGALRAMEEAGLPIDAVGGTSLGAGIAALHATGAGYEAQKEACRAFFGVTGSILDYTPPVVALTSGNRLTRRLKACFGEAAIEDLWLRYFCVSSNLTRAEEMVHRFGPVWKQVRASVSLPGVFPPVCADGDLLVDGALMNNLPVDVMRTVSNGGTVVAVDVTRMIDLPQEPFGDTVSGWQALLDRLNPFSTRARIPHIIGILMRATELASVNAQMHTAKEADVCISLPVQEFGLLNFRSVDQLIDIGYRHTAAQLEQWLKTHPPTW